MKCEFEFEVRAAPKILYLLLETPELFKIEVNGKALNYAEDGFYIDTAFKKINISKYVSLGKNKIRLSCNFQQSEKVYKDFEDSFKFASVRNKLSYDTEIEPIYLLGDFGVYTADKIVPVSEKAFKIDGNFYIDNMKKQIFLSDMEKQGFLFFAGRLTLKKEFFLEATDYKLKFNVKGINSIKIKVNGKNADALIFNPFEADISDYLKKGKNIIEITVANNLRNLLGPHHFITGTLNYTAPPNFYKEPCIWYDKTEADWNPEYCFINTGVE